MTTSSPVRVPPTASDAKRTGRSRHSGRRPRVSKRGVTALAVLPATVLTLVFMVLPLLQGIRLSVSTWYGVGPVTYSGVTNYRTAFNSGLGSTLWLTAKYAVLTTAGIMLLATLMAAAVSARVRGFWLYRVVWFLPGIAPITAVAVFWATAFQPHHGVVNVALGALGLGDAHAWLASADNAIYPPIFVTVWASVGFAFLLMLGAMEQIPLSIYEAARIDGASAIRTLISITLPLVRPVLAVTTLLEFIWAFNGFSVLWAMTQGGPGFATAILPVQVYRQAFEQTNFGLASAMAVVGGAILMAIGAVALRLSRSKQEAAT